MLPQMYLVNSHQHLQVSDTGNSSEEPSLSHGMRLGPLFYALTAPLSFFLLILTMLTIMHTCIYMYPYGTTLVNMYLSRSLDCQLQTGWSHDNISHQCTAHLALTKRPSIK